jgi:hypothetical protein
MIPRTSRYSPKHLNHWRDDLILKRGWKEPWQRDANGKQRGDFADGRFFASFAHPSLDTPMPLR